MPGNEVEDRVHNFFAQEDLSSNHHQSQSADGSWHGQGSNLWPGSHMHIGLSSSSSKAYNSHQSDTERGQNSHSFQVAHDINHAQTTPGVALAKSHSQSQLPNSNGFMHGPQFLQTRQSEANFLGFDTEPDRHTMTSSGISNFESQGRIGLENNIGSVRSELSESRIGFDFLGSHQQMSRQQMGMQQSLPQQMSGFNDMQPLQQQAMLRKMQEIQRQQLEALHNNSPNQNPPIINGTPISANNSWPADPSVVNKSWLHRAVQGPSNEFRFPSEQGQTLSLMGLTPQQTDQSLFGVPVSNMRGNSSHFSNVAEDKHPKQQMAMFSNSSQGDQYRGPTNQVNMQDGSLGSRQRSQEENFFGRPSGQTLVRGMYSGNTHLVHSLQRDSPLQELSSPSEIMEEKTALPVSSLQDAVALDPTEEKILFGTGNIWDSFGDSVDVGAGGGSWSALMQSAVGETSNNNLGLQEEWSGPNGQNLDVSLGPLSDDININKNFQGVPGFQRHVNTYPSEHGDRQQMDYMHTSFQHFSEEGKQVHRNATNSPVAINAKSMPSSWCPQQNVPSHISGPLYGKSNGREDVETPSCGNEVSKFYENNSRLQRSGSNDQNRMLQMNQGAHMWKPIPGLQARTGIDSPQVNREGGIFNNHMGKPNSSTPRASFDQGTNLNSNNLNLQKHAEPSKMRNRNEHHLNKGSLVLESSMNGSGNDVVNVHETESNERKENSSESHYSNISQPTTSGGLNDKVCLDGSDTRNLLGGKQKAPGQGGQKVFGPRKFQYHPMGNSEESAKSSFGRKSVVTNQTQGYLGQSNSFEHIPNSSSEMEKEHMFGVQQNRKGTDDSPARGTLTNISQSSQNVLALSRNMDQSKENSNSDGSIGPCKQSQSPSSHGFSLQLGFPSQLLPSHSSAQLAGPLSSAHTTPDMRNEDSTSQAGGEFKRNGISVTGTCSNDSLQNKMLGNLNSGSTSGLPFSRSQFHSQQVSGEIDKHDPHALQTRFNMPDRLPLSEDTPYHTDSMAIRGRGATQEVSMGRMPSQKNLLGGQPHNKFPPRLFRPSLLNSNAVSIPSSQDIGVYVESQQAKGSLHQQVRSADLASKPIGSQGKESVIKNQSDGSPSNSASAESDFEAFGRTLKPSSLPPPNYSLLNQLQSMKSIDFDPSSRGLKRFKGAESGGGSQMRLSSEQNVSSVGSQRRPSSEQNTMVEDPKVHSFSGPAGTVNNNSPSLLANVPPQDVLAHGRMNSGTYLGSTSTSSLRVEHSQISPQMAPSWFEQYGTFKNGQMLSMYNANKHSTLKTIEHRLPLANSMKAQATVAADPVQAGSIWQRSIPTPVTVENLPSHVEAQELANKDLVVARLKKRKSVAPLLSWHKEVTQRSRNILNISMAEIEWAKAANRLSDKVEDEAETFEDGPPRRRSKRRLILTTQLMQQLFRPPVAGILSAEAYSNYEAVACMSARHALGDSCSLMPCSQSGSSAPLDSINPLVDNDKTRKSDRISDQRISEVAEQFIGRAKKLENDFIRLDKRASVVDLRVESQDLDKISVINRFARVHGRGQGDLASPGPQRYVNALPMPRVLPERVQCLSL